MTFGRRGSAAIAELSRPQYDGEQESNDPVRSVEEFVGKIAIIGIPTVITEPCNFAREVVSRTHDLRLPLAGGSIGLKTLVHKTEFVPIRTIDRVISKVVKISRANHLTVTDLGYAFLNDPKSAGETIKKTVRDAPPECGSLLVLADYPAIGALVWSQNAFGANQRWRDFYPSPPNTSPSSLQLPIALVLEGMNKEMLLWSVPPETI